MKSRIEEDIKAILNEAIHAPSGDNCQPWLFRIETHRLLIFHDEALAKHSLNRNNHASALALGALLESIKIAAPSYGLKANAKLNFKMNSRLSLWAKVDFAQFEFSQEPLAKIISMRTTDRRPYQKSEMSQGLLNEIMGFAKSYKGCNIHFKNQQSSAFLSYFLKSESQLWQNKKIVKDLTHWMRLSKNEVSSNSDGMSWQNIGINSFEAILMRAMKKFPLLPKLLWHLGFKFRIESLAKKSIKNSAGLICFTTNSISLDSLTEVGSLAYRTWLHLNSKGYGVQPLSFCSTSVADYCAGALSPATNQSDIKLFKQGLEVLKSNFNLESNEIPVWIFRTGVSSPLPPEKRTKRRNIDEFTIQESSTKKFNYDLAFSRNLGWVTQREQQKLRHSRVAIAGMGGVGGSHFLSLVRLGITKFHIADFDIFEIQNFNRQVGATTESLGKEKIAVMIQEALRINPELEIKRFSQGVHQSNLQEFLEKVDVYVDGLDAFALQARSEVFAAAYQKGIPAVTAAPIGMGTALLNFLPGRMSFEQYFGIENARNEKEKIARFVLGLTPSALQMPAIAAREFFNLEQKKGPSTIMGCSLASGVLCTEILKLLLGRGKVLAAPSCLHFDAFSNRYKKTWTPFGYRNPIFRIKLFIFKIFYLNAGNESTSSITSESALLADESMLGQDLNSRISYPLDQ